MSQLTTDPAAFLQWIKQQIPLTAAMQLQQLTFDGRQLRITAPLAPNVNDKGTGFGGSLASIATLAGWALTTLYLRHQGLECDVVIADSHLRYLAPVNGDFEARVSLPLGDESEQLLQRMQQRGRGRLELQVEILCNGELCLSLDGRYVAMRRADSQGA